MNNIEQRKSDILSLFRSLDISSTMYKNAEQKYKALAKLLQQNGIECDIYPQGSFAIGTVVRPIRNGKDDNYDLDVVCEVLVDKKSTTPECIKKSVGKVIVESKQYNISEEYDACWTIIFADIDGVGFSMDVVPAVDEDEETKKQLCSKTKTSPILVNKSIAITMKENAKYNWKTNNPKGYKEWFEEINEPFISYTREQRKALYEADTRMDATVEELPSDYERSSLQIAIQMLKRHRDIYYDKVKSENVRKPISAIISTLVATIASSAPIRHYDPFQLLEYVVREVDSYYGLHKLQESGDEYAGKNLIRKSAGKWILENPVNPEDNLLDAWNEQPGTSQAFFKWLKAVKEDFIDSLEFEDRMFMASLHNALGNESLKNSKLFEKYNNKSVPDVVIPAKPWRDACDLF